MLHEILTFKYLHIIIKMQRIEWKKNVLLPVKDSHWICNIINADFQSHTTWEYVLFYQSRGAAEFNCLFHTFFTHLVHNVSMNFVWQRKRRFKMFNLIFELFYSTAFLSKNCTWSTTISLITIWVTKIWKYYL